MARKINFPEDGKIGSKEYHRLEEHIRNSAIWYATNMALNKNLIIDRLKDKGLKDEYLTVAFNDGLSEEHNLLEETMQFLEDSLLVDDEHYARRLIERGLASGKGLNAIKSTLIQKKVDAELANDLLEEFAESEEAQELRFEAIEKAYNRALTNASYKKELAKEAEGQWANPRSIIIRYLATRGFPFGEIEEFLNSKDD